MEGDLHRKCPVCGGTGFVAVPIGQRVKKLRELRGLTQEQMSRELGISRPSIANIEAGKQDVPSTTLMSLHRLYGVSLDWLFGVSDEASLYRAEDPTHAD